MLLILAIMLITYNESPLFTIEAPIIAGIVAKELVQTIGYTILIIPIIVIAFGVIMFIRKDPKEVLLVQTVLIGIIALTMSLVWVVAVFSGTSNSGSIDTHAFQTVLNSNAMGGIFMATLLISIASLILLSISLHRQIKSVQVKN